jgi:hypothetical protein
MWRKNRAVPPPSGPTSPRAARTALADAYAAWYTAYANTIGPHTPVETEAKNGAKEAAKKLIRPFVNQYLRYDPVTNEDRTAMSIPNKDTIPTPVPPPVAQAEADLTFPGIHLVELAKIRAVQGAEPDARSDYGVRIYYGLTGPASDKHKFRLTTGSRRPAATCPIRFLPGERRNASTLTGRAGTRCTFVCVTRTARERPGRLGRC